MLQITSNHHQWTHHNPHNKKQKKPKKPHQPTPFFSPPDTKTALSRQCVLQIAFKHRQSLRAGVLHLVGTYVGALGQRRGRGRNDQTDAPVVQRGHQRVEIATSQLVEKEKVAKNEKSNDGVMVEKIKFFNSKKPL